MILSTKPNNDFCVIKINLYFLFCVKMSSTVKSTCNQSGWCIPLIIFSVLVVFHALQLFNRNILKFFDTEIWFLVIAGAIGLFMYQLCKCGHNLIAFGFLLFPLLIFVIATYINRAQSVTIGDNL